VIKVKQKMPAKINLTLDITGVNERFHEINSLVASIDVCDTVTIIKRKDDIVTLREKGIPAGCSTVDNNAFKAAKLFMQTFHTNGVDIIIDKKIPVSGGLGGSSADAVAVLIGMNKLYKVGAALKPLADKLGSDTGYMLGGGYAKISGRGDIVTKIDSDKTLYLLLIAEDTGITAKECYKLYDELNLPITHSADKAVEILTKNSENWLEEFSNTVKNDLYEPSKLKINNLESNILALKNSGALVSLMTGSGSTVYGIYENKRARDDAFKELKKTIPERLLLPAKTLHNKTLFEKTFYKYFNKKDASESE